MNGSQILSALALFFYALTFLFFVRLLAWKRYTTRLIWNRKKKISLVDLHYMSNHLSKTLPKISLLIPARDESAVIAQTIENLLKLDYPSSLYEIVVITDEREEISRKNQISSFLSEWESYLPDHPNQLNKESLHMFKIYQLNRGNSGDFYFGLWVEYGHLLEPVFSMDLILNKLKRATEKSLLRYLSKTGNLSDNIQISLRSEFPSIEQGIILQLVPRLETRLVNFMASFDYHFEKSEISRSLEALLTTTKKVANIWKEKASKTGHQVRVLEVPISYEGSHSTKGRALNYALEQLSEEVMVVGFYDAESRPDPEVLIYVANEYLAKGEQLPILQGPLFQVRNFYSLSLVSKLGGLFKAVSHDWYLPIIFKTIPFVGGTNLFVRKSLLTAVEGFDPESLTEDLDFGIRAYLKTGTKVEFLPVISTEQTPPKLSQYFVQRLRWASGHLEVMSKLKKTTMLYWQLLIKGPLEWLTYQTSGLVVIAVNIYFVLTKLHLMKSNLFITNPVLAYGFAFLNIPYLLFSVYCLNRYEYTFDKNLQVFTSFPLLEWLKLIVSSMFIFLLPLPYTWAIILRIAGKAPRRWVKTERSIE